MESKPIVMVNPSGQRKELWNWEYHELLVKFAGTKVFREWSNRRNIAGEVKLNGKMTVSVSAVEMFLRESGYVVEKDVNDLSKLDYGKGKS